MNWLILTRRKATFLSSLFTITHTWRKCCQLATESFDLCWLRKHFITVNCCKLEQSCWNYDSIYFPIVAGLKFRFFVRCDSFKLVSTCWLIMEVALLTKLQWCNSEAELGFPLHYMRSSDTWVDLPLVSLFLSIRCSKLRWAVGRFMYFWHISLRLQGRPKGCLEKIYF